MAVGVMIIVSNVAVLWTDHYSINCSATYRVFVVSGIIAPQVNAPAYQCLQLLHERPNNRVESVG